MGQTWAGVAAWATMQLAGGVKGAPGCGWLLPGVEVAVGTGVAVAEGGPLPGPPPGLGPGPPGLGPGPLAVGTGVAVAGLEGGPPIGPPPGPPGVPGGVVP